MRNFVKSVKIKGLWGVKNVHIDLFEDVNILFGGNGSGKTTFLHIVEALLNLDFGDLDDLYFDEVEIVIHNDENNKLLVQRLMDDMVTPSYRYVFSDGEVIDIKSSDIRTAYRGRLVSRNLYMHLKDRLNEMANVSWLSINRLNESFDRSERRLDLARTDVDLKLNQLMNQIVSYRLQLETKVNERTKKFNEDIVSLLLFNRDYDKFPSRENIQKIKSYTKDYIVTELHKVFSYFGNPREHTQQIQQHAEIISHVVDKLDSNEGSFTAEELLSLSLMIRTGAILGLSSEYQADKAKIMEPLTLYLTIVTQYLKDKRMEFSPVTGELIPSVKIGDKKERALDINSLSSGEKQLLILLTETLLQQSLPYIFIADEPELSLHIEWQRNLINSIRSLNPNAQIIFATHAPEIAANHALKLINMQKVTTYVEQ